MIGLGLSVAQAGGRGRGPAFTPAQLFAAGAEGLWLDPGDPGASFQDSDGYLPVTAVGQPVALMLDKRGQTAPFEARRNRLTHSDDLAQSVWIKSRSTVSANAAVAPDGAMTAHKLVVNTTANNNHRLEQSVAVVAGTAYTLSVHLRAAELPAVNLRFAANFPVGNAAYNAITGVATVAGSGTASMVDLGGGWFRCMWTQTATVSGTVLAQIILHDGVSITIANGDGVSGAYLWRAQLETGAVVTPAQVTGAGVGSWVPGKHAVQTTTPTEANRFVLRHDMGLRYSVQRLGTAAMAVQMPNLGAAATVAYAYWANEENLGVAILTGQTISGAMALPSVARLGPVVVIGRALSNMETARLSGWLAQRVPGNWLMGTGAWDDTGVWSDEAIWSMGEPA